MQIQSQFPIVSQPTSGRAQGAQSNPQHTPQHLPSTVSPTSSLDDFDRLMNSDSASRFRRVDDFSASTQQALSAYQATESLSAANPRNHLIGIDVFA